ncbi:MAG: InlB B-repeat-containing protein [Clostridia bacterium]|nr:InlB B-repeat-containing protein [Clostridia bacterium]
MKKIKMLLVTICLLTFCFSIACSKVNFAVYFMVDGEEYAVVNTNGAEISMPKNPEKEDYVFDGWYWDDGVWQVPFTLESLAKTSLSDKMCVYAKFTLEDIGGNNNNENTGNEGDNNNNENAGNEGDNNNNENSGNEGNNNNNENAGNEETEKPNDGNENKEEPVAKDVREYNGHVYQAFEGHYTWEEAREYCASLGGHLATVTSAEEQAVLEEFYGDYWLGGTDVEEEGVWKWITGEEWNYTNWLEGEPNNSGEEHYLVIWPNTWNDLCLDSSEQYGFICEWEDDYAVVNEDEIIYRNHRYKVFKEWMSWEEAKAYCESLGGHLATITSAKEQEAMEYFNGRYWLGGTDAEEEGVWKWITGEEWNYTNWLEGEPNNMGEEHYLVIWPNTWNDLCLDSSEQYGFICEWESLNKPEELPEDDTEDDTEDAKGDITSVLVVEANGHKYEWFEGEVTWEEAKAYCESLGGHLATVTSAEEQKIIEQLDSRYWLGATDELTEGEWRWITGEPWEYTNWRVGEPNGAESENYLEVWGDIWNDMANDDSNQYGFICEWDYIESVE